MRVSLHIENEETCRPVDELSRLTSETMTAAVVVALRERLEPARRQRDVDGHFERLLAIGERCA